MSRNESTAPVILSCASFKGPREKEEPHSPTMIFPDHLFGSTTYEALLKHTICAPFCIKINFQTSFYF